ncbi:metalloregulator ArsR/SmtB family transcription factor [Agromyces lapidis]|uniref:Metalloregulator ArsR/SmtB family transcription factor n=1 Tax=Agromyces lapidis TaxID=279574 RepID=A0ABV5STV5_9MICO|nr:metalloregulator ArsR/SmtB family transcription factor [Agromyces lapidis]
MNPRPSATNELRLVGDPTRARILSLILGSDDQRALVGDLAVKLELKQPTVSHHVKALFDDGVLERQPDGRRVWYSVAPAHRDWLVDLLAGDPGEIADGALDRVVGNLSERFAGTFNPETIEQYVRESRDLLMAREGSGQHLASLTARFAAERLEALAASKSEYDGGVPEVLFVCVHNSGRSQMASAILRQLAGERIAVRTAGSAPAAGVRGTVVTALDEIGVPLGGEYPKPLTDEVVRAADVVVTMGCGDVCPIYPGKQYLDWDLEDPAGLPLAGVRAVRDAIESRVRQLLRSLTT